MPQPSREAGAALLFTLLMTDAMKNISAVLVLLMPLWVLGQAKFDNTWVFGYDYSDTSSSKDGTIIQFINGDIQYTAFEIPWGLKANAAISNSSGQLLFYTNGCKIMSSKHEIMISGNGINEGGYYYEQNCYKIYDGYPTTQGIVILPWPGRPSQYYMVHLHRPGSVDHAASPYITNVLMTTVDMTKDGGLGMVTEKNKVVMSGDTVVDMLTAVRHGNGRDWWLVAPGYNNSKYYSFLLSPKGLEGPFVQKIGQPINLPTRGGQAVFSPSGKTYAVTNPRDSKGDKWFRYLQAFDFDRCTGLFSPIDTTGTLLDGGNAPMGGVAFSANSRYLYSSGGTYLYQFDMLSEDVFGSQQLVGIWDGFDDPLATNFFQMMLAPDDKIYMTHGNGSKYLHVIHEPQKAGEACEFEQRGVELFGYHAFSPPNFPYFRLFDAQDTPCDTLGITIAPPKEDTLVKPLPCVAEARLYPNPAIASTWLESPGCQALGVSVYDILGRHMQDLALPADAVRVPIDLSGYAAGVYMLRVQAEGGAGKVLPLVVLRR